ncbi:MAG TPA: heparinase II/III-family protein, partial [Blastocatellia bacterium]|nr:heparinase II/III-family protein [Blastocatellia bacterium]
YHRYTTDFYFNLLILAHQNNINLEKELSPVLSQMAEYLCRTMRPDGTVLLIGDDDGGKLLSLSCRDPYDFRDSLALASALFGKPEWKYVAGADVPELLWLIGPDGHSRYSQLKAQRPLDYFRAFEESGQYFGRTGWGETSSWLFFRCGPPAALSGAHEHADQLSFEFFADGVPWLVDPGTYTYTLDETARNEFRLSGAHNTLIVDSQPQSSPKGPFSWNERAGGKAGRVFANPQLTYIEGVHDGYQSLDPPVDHHRSLLLVRRDEDSSFEMPDYLIAHDRLKTDGDHGYSLAYHFGPEVDAEADSTGFRARHSLGNSLLIRHRSTMDFRASVCASFLSERYGHRRESRLGLLHASGRGEHEISTIILPVSADAPFQPCVSIPCESTGSIRVRSQKTQDWIQFGSGVLNVGEWSVSASSSILWIRRSSSGLLRVAMVGANALAIDGLFELRLAAADGIVLCELHGDQLSLSFGPTTEVDLSVAGNLRRVISASDCMEVTAGSGLRHVKGVWTVFRRD